MPRLCCEICTCPLIGPTRIGPDGIERHRGCHVAAEAAGRFAAAEPAPGLDAAPPVAAAWRPLPEFSRYQGTATGRLLDLATGVEVAPTVAPWTLGYFTVRRDDGAERTLTLAHLAGLVREAAWAGRPRKGARS